ncbi:hypothetical protein EDC04DRAFT_2604162 [Pisolithus marmoratus]|nr:hypothetical protein EDC04DRAFT_2604162 [Pisolithus marmoratus]
MPWKAKMVDGSTGGGDRSGSSRKKTLVKDTLLPNMWKGEAPQVEQMIEDMNALNEKVDQVLIGMKGDGSRSHHKGKKAKLLPELKLKDGLPLDFKLAAAGSQHQLYALVKWYDIKCKQLEEWKWEEASVLSEDAATISEDVIDDLNKRIKPNVKTLEGVLACGGQWLVMLYDKNKISKQLGLHISHNKTKHVYMESLMEGLIQIFRAHCAADKTFKDITTIAHAKGTPAKQRELLKLDYVWDVMSYFDAAGTHFWHSDIMKFGDFYNTMMTSYGGILAYVVRKSESCLCYCFNTLLLDDTDVDVLLMSIKSDPNDAASTTVLRGIYNSLKSASPVISAITSGIRLIINKCFIMFFGDTQAASNFANPSSKEWVTVFAQYSNTLLIKFKELVLGIHSIHSEWLSLRSNTNETALVALVKSDIAIEPQNFAQPAQTVSTLCQDTRMSEPSMLLAHAPQHFLSL